MPPRLLLCWGEGKSNMFTVILVFDVLLLLAVLALYFRKSPAQSVADPRLAQLPDQITRLDARADSLDRHLREALAQIRVDLGAEANATRESAAAAAASQRTELQNSLTGLHTVLDTRFDSFREDNRASAETLRLAVQNNLDAIAQRLSGFIADSSRDRADSQATLHTKLNELGSANIDEQNKLRTAVQERLDHLNTTNAAKLEEMRATVDEKLQSTLHQRLTESFGEVTKHLGDVQKGLGEMKELATGVGDLKKVLSNVKSRGIVGEFQLGQQLEQMFSPEQYIKNARIKPSTSESVEYALKFPNAHGTDGYTLLPIDAKFPMDAWERLEHVYEHGSADEILAAGKTFERVIKVQADSICKKYIDPPTTLPFGVMFLPTESMYAEVVRRPGLQAEMQSNCHVMIAGPSTFMALLTSFQMGFQSLKLEAKGHEIRNILAQAKTQFGKFGDLLGTVETHLGRAQGTLQDLGVRSRAINRALKNVESLEAHPEQGGSLLQFAAVAPLLAASGTDDEE